MGKMKKSSAVVDVVTKSENSTNNLLDDIRSKEPELRRSERKVAVFLLADPERFLRLTVAEASTLAEVSQPTVMRFSVTVGCEGFQDLKLRLAHSLALGGSAHSALDPSDPIERVVEKIFDFTIASLDRARRGLDTKRMSEAIALLIGARSIEFFGHGSSHIVALDAQQKFPLFDVPCGAQLDSHQQLMVAMMMRPGDVAVIISHTGVTASLIEIARAVRKAGASCIAVCGNDAPLAEECDVALLVETLDKTDVFTPTISRIGALVIMDILSTAVALRRSPEHAERLIGMKQRLAEMRSTQAL